MFWKACLAAALAGSTATALDVIHEKRDVPLSSRSGRVDPDAVIPIRIGLKQNNLETGYDRLMEVSHPSSDRYGKHYSADEVHDMFAPSEETVQTVKSWLVDAGVDVNEIKHYKNKGWLAIDLPAAQAERLLSTEYYEHELSDSTRIGCDSYSLPEHVSPHVDLIKPGIVLSAPLKKRTLEKRHWGGGWPPGGGNGQWPGPGGPWPGPAHRPPFWSPGWQPPPGAGSLPADLQGCSANITPVCIEALYGLPKPGSVPTSPVNVMGLYESGDYFSVADIELFFENFAPWVPQGTVPKVLSVDGGESPVPADSPYNGGESDIDIDLAQSLIYPQTVTIYQVDDLPNALGELGKAGFLNTFLDSVDGSYCDYTAFGITGDSPSIDATYPDTSGLPGAYTGQLECGVYELTRVVSVSYGEYEQAFPKNYVERQCNEFMKLGLQGHSIFVASGDYGVASFPDSTNNTNGCIGDGTIYAPDYPVGCPYITAVGATQLYPNQTVYDPESTMQINFTALEIAGGQTPGPVAYEFFASGGGFSNYFSPPKYQQKAVANYLKYHSPDVPSYVVNADASNIGENGGKYNRAGRGYPDVAANGAFLEAFNNETLEHWFGTSLASPIFGSTVTLLNEERTAIGKGPIGFINPVLYENPWVLNDITNGSNPNCGSSGFKASTGWDPVSGLGTPNYERMLALFLALP